MGHRNFFLFVQFDRKSKSTLKANWASKNARFPASLENSLARLHNWQIWLPGQQITKTLTNLQHLGVTKMAYLNNLKEKPNAYLKKVKLNGEQSTLSFDARIWWKTNMFLDRREWNTGLRIECLNWSMRWSVNTTPNRIRWIECKQIKFKIYLIFSWRCKFSCILLFRWVAPDR